MSTKCPSITKSGKQCRGHVPKGRTYCISHDPAWREELREAARRGGEGKATPRRLAKQWAELGRAMGDDDLSDILKSCMFAVKEGDMSPSVASAIATLARTAVAVTQDVELMKRIEALEDRVKTKDPAIRKVV